MLAGQAIFAYACGPGRTQIRKILPRCPRCQAANTRRSKRRSVADYFMSVLGSLPWRCENCEARFRARHVLLRNLFHAHCGICGNLELQRISAERVPGIAAILARALGMPALRCEPCRNKFFSVRPLQGKKARMAATQSR
jgi:hypothetical protein